MATLLFTPKGAISPEDKKELKANGYLIVEVDDTNQIKTVSDLGFIGADDLFLAAIEVVSQANINGSIHGEFARAVFKRAIPKINKISSNPILPVRRIN